MAPTKADLDVMVSDLQVQVEELKKQLTDKDHRIQELEVISAQTAFESGKNVAQGPRAPTANVSRATMASRQEASLGLSDRLASPSLDCDVTEAARAALAEARSIDVKKGYKLDWDNFVFKPAKDKYLKGASNWRTYESLLLTALVLTGFDEANTQNMSPADRVKLALHIGQTMQAEPFALVEGMNDGVEMLQTLRGAYGGANMARGQKALEDLTRLRYDGGCPFHHIAEFRRLIRMAATSCSGPDETMKLTLFLMTTRDKAYHWTNYTEKFVRWTNPSMERILDDFAQEFRHREGKGAEKRHDQPRTSSSKIHHTNRAYTSETNLPRKDSNNESLLAAGKRSTSERKKQYPQKQKDNTDIVCFTCNEKGHIARNCPRKGHVNRTKKPELNPTSFQAAADDIMEELRSYQVTTDKTMLAIAEDAYIQELSKRSIPTEAQTLQSISQPTENSRQIFDTGADVHITNSINDFLPSTIVKITNTPLKIMTGAGPVFPTHAGTARYDFVGLHGERQSVLLKMTLFVPRFPVKIFSGERFYKAGGRLDGHKLIDRNGGVITTLNPQQRGFELWHYGKPEPTKYFKLTAANPSLAAPDSRMSTTNQVANDPQNNAEEQKTQPSDELSRKLVLWHRRLCHPSQERLLRTIKLTTGIDVCPDVVKSLPCWACDVSKIKRVDSHDERQPASYVGDVTNIDLGEIKPISIDGHKIFCLIVDSFSRFQTIETFPSKDKVWPFVEAYFLRVIAQLKTATNGQRTMNAVQVDGGTEISTSNMTKFVNKHGMTLRVSSPDNQYQNGISERRIGVLQDAAATVVYQNKIPTCFWNHVLKAVVFVQNRIATSPVRGATPMELYTKALTPDKLFTVDNSILRIIGSRCAVLIDKTHRDRAEKLNPKGEDAIFLGYQGNHNYVTWLLEGQRILVTPHVIFHESVSDSGDVPDPKDIVRSLPQHVQRRLRHRTKTRSYVRAKDNNVVNEDKTDDEGNVRPRRGRPKKTRVELYLLEAPSEHDDVQEALEQEQKRDKLAYFESGNEVPNPLEIMAAQGNKLTCDEPTLKEALNSPNRKEWIQAIFQEIEENLRRGTFLFLPASNIPDARFIDSKWVLKRKYTAEGELDKFKARICARGFTQKYGLDYNETFASTARVATWRILLALAAIKSWHVHQIDFVAAYLNGDLHERIIMKQFPGLKTYFSTHADQALHYSYTPNSAIQLKKPLYGLKQSGAEWQRKIKSILSLCHFHPLISDSATYYNSATGDIITTHVDDFLLFGPSSKRIEETTRSIGKHVPVQDLGDAKWFLKVRIDRSSPTGSITITQEQYHQKIVEEEAEIPT